jgi:hypothetical protein
MGAIKISEADFMNLKSFGITSPYDYIFKVGKEYIVECPTLPEQGQLRVRCSQNCPITIKLIEP